MANRIVSLHAGIYGIGIYVIMLPSSGSRSLILYGKNENQAMSSLA